jgi:hypothetical protein
VSRDSTRVCVCVCATLPFVETWVKQELRRNVWRAISEYWSLKKMVSTYCHVYVTTDGGWDRRMDLLTTYRS